MNKIYLALGLVFISSMLNAGKVTPCAMYSLEDTLVTPNAVPGRVSSNGLYFIGGFSNENDKELLYLWKRSTLDAAWSEPILLKGEINELTDSSGNMQPTITDDGLVIIFVRNPGSGWEGNDLWIATRASVYEAFGDVRSLDELNTDDAEAYPWLSANGSRVYYTANDMILVAEYDAKAKKFGNVKEVVLDGIESPISCWLSPDEKTILVTDGYSLYRSERKSTTKSFGKPEEVALEFPDNEDGFFSSPSLDPKGDLYVYISVQMASQEEPEYYQEEDYDVEYEEYPESYETVTVQAILRFLCQRGK